VIRVTVYGGRRMRKSLAQAEAIAEALKRGNVIIDGATGYRIVDVILPGTRK
jgi:hypothetical protein